MVGASPGEYLFADDAHAHVLTDDDEYLAKLVGTGDPFAPFAFAIRNHIESPRTAGPLARRSSLELATELARAEIYTDDRSLGCETSTDFR